LRDSVTNTDCDSNGNSYIHTDSHCDSYGNSERDSHGDRDSHGYANTHRYRSGDCSNESRWSNV
jgi:hypothetical protein